MSRFARNDPGGVPVDSAGILLTVGNTIVECVVLHLRANKDRNQRQPQPQIPIRRKKEKKSGRGIAKQNQRV